MGQSELAPRRVWVGEDELGLEAWDRTVPKGKKAKRAFQQGESHEADPSSTGAFQAAELNGQTAGD